MKISLSWLHELVEFELDGESLARLLTGAGLEVEARTPFADFSGVIVAEVRGKLPHPNAAKLTLVDVWDGAEVTRVVCGAPNVPDPGARVIWARPGSRLPGGIEIAAKEVRGVSSPGMLCAEDELGIGTSHAGIIILDDVLAAGQLLSLADEILEVNVTPNRPDCLGHVGVAREVAALTGGRLRLPSSPSVVGAGESPRVEIDDVEGCPRYSAIAFEGVKVGPSPLAVRARLQSLGVRAISNIVDATNLILLEAGQPLHAFDLDELSGGRIVVRRARPGEKMHTLDGAERELSPDDVAICDSERPVAVAGVMGGATSEVSATTTRVLLESAYFSPSRVRRTAKRLGLRTEASHRFERGVDPSGVVEAAQRCAQLFAELAGARAAAPIRDVYPRRIEPARLGLRVARTRAVLGADIDGAEQTRILSSLGLDAELRDSRIDVVVPTRRPDLVREIDLVEEVARIVGYHHFAPTLPPLRSPPLAMPGDALARVVETTRDALRGLGLEEVVTYHFVPPARLALLSAPSPIVVANPLRAEQSAMRTTLMAGLLEVLLGNLSRGTVDVRLFEVGDVFLPGGARSRPRFDTGVDERRRVAGLLTGHADGWLKPGAELDLFDVKGVVVELLAALGFVARYQASGEPWLHPGAQAQVAVGGEPVGLMGELHPDLARQLGLSARAFVFELDLRQLLASSAPVLMQELPRFPPVVRDLSFFIAAEVPAQKIADALDGLKSPLCVGVQLLEDYREAGHVPAGCKGMLWSLTYRAPDRTLTDAEVESLHEALRRELSGALAVTLR